MEHVPLRLVRRSQNTGTRTVSDQRYVICAKTMSYMVKKTPPGERKVKAKRKKSMFTVALYSTQQCNAIVFRLPTTQWSFPVIGAR